MFDVTRNLKYLFGFSADRVHWDHLSFEVFHWQKLFSWCFTYFLIYTKTFLHRNTFLCWFMFVAYQYYVDIKNEKILWHRKLKSETRPSFGIHYLDVNCRLNVISECQQKAFSTQFFLKCFRMSFIRSSRRFCRLSNRSRIHGSISKPQSENTTKSMRNECHWRRNVTARRSYRFDDN